jgi:hypothetical protein
VPNPCEVIATVGLVLVLTACAMARGLEALLRVLDIDPVEALVYFGLAEHDAAPAPGRRGG